MATQTKILSAEGYKKIQSELTHLKTVKRKEVAEEIKVARGYGDLSENAEYEEARKQQTEIEARIEEIESLLKYAEVIDEDDIDMEHVSVGTTVKVSHSILGKDVDYQMVGATEADPIKRKVSVESPIGNALNGKAVGEVVEIEIPAGVLKLKVLEISR